MTNEPGDRPHLIRRQDVVTWLTDSVNQRVTIHRTTAESAARILEIGVEIEASRVASFGQGFYSATWPDPPEGMVDVHVAVRTRRPLIGSLDGVAVVIDDLARIVSPGDPRITPEVAAGIRQHLLELGYDGIMVWDGGGDGIDYVVAIVEDSVKVVVD